MKLDIGSLVEYCLQNNIEFVSYRLPGTQNPVTMISSGDGSKTDMHSIMNENSLGFIMAPFTNSSLPMVKLMPDIIVEGFEFKETLFDKLTIKPKENRHLNISASQSSQADYFEMFHQFKNHIATRYVEKVVLSGILTLGHLSYCHAASLYLRLLRSYPNAFVYLINTKPTGTWVGATPETLVSSKGNTFHTMALASTQPFKEEKNITWDQKEINEHEYVRSFIKEKLVELNIRNIEESKTVNVKAGNMVHLKTVFKGNLSTTSPLEIANKLHPTPAICGTPAEKAKKLILETEKHNREYYTGFLGPVYYKQSSHLFVNLRCAKLDSKQTTLYAGGGIVHGSSPEKEWDEIQMKFKTMAVPIEQTFCEERSKNKKYAS